MAKMEGCIIRFHIFILFFISTIEATATNSNETDDSRKSRATGRIVKLYSGTRPEPIVCADEGFQADSHDCAVFHRCMKSGNGKYTVFRFQCGPGTVYDPETEVCNHPHSTKRSECGGLLTAFVDRDHANEIDGGQHEVPSPISTKHPMHTEGTTTHKSIRDVSTHHRVPEVSTMTSSPYIGMPASISSTMSSTSAAYPLLTSTIYQKPQFSETSKATVPLNVISSTWKPGVQDKENICTSDGFMGDTGNCRKFYRCVVNQRGGYTRFEFSCSESTIWDDDVQGCNHAWAVKRTRCGRNSLNIIEHTEHSDQSAVPDKTIQQQLQISYGSEVTQTQTQIGNGSVIQNQTQINYGDRLNPAKVSNIKQNQTQVSHGSASSQSQIQIDYGNKGVQTQLQIDHSDHSSQIQTQEYASTTQGTSSLIPSKEPTTNKNIECVQSGFMGDSNDCKKFYRCVDNSRGGYTRFEFSCGEGTVWDPKLEACNHAWAVKECGGNAQPETTTHIIDSSSSKTTQNYHTALPAEGDYTTSHTGSIDTNEDIGYGNQNEQPPTTTSSTTVTKLSTTESWSNEQPEYGNQDQQHTTISTTEAKTSTTGASSGIGTECMTSGFMGDENDCKIFYRCVENGKGFTKYEFKCGDGTVWDPNIEACNHAWAVKKCGGSASTDINKLEGTTIVPTAQTTFTHNVPTTTTTMKPMSTDKDDYDTGYGSQNNNFSTLTSTTKHPQKLDNNLGNTCVASGFMGDEADCKRFYRCVDNGDGSFNRYEFTCGEGTVWDPDIDACNHAWAVKQCGGGGHGSGIEHQETTAQPQSSSTHESQATSSSTEKYDNTTMPTTIYSTTSITTTTLQSVSTSSNKCVRDGFMGDSKDCKKFYRCVDSGSGSYTRYEFSCGEGTVWDPKIDACNHAWAVEKCGVNIESTEDNMTTTSSYYTTISDVHHDNYPTDTQPQGTESHSTTQSITVQSTTEEVKDSMNNVCKKSGFIGDKKDCKKFYRCVDDGKGSFIRYEFSCGDGTLWDQSIEACNHAWAVKDCVEDGNHSTSTQTTSTDISHITSESEDQGYVQHTEATSTSSIAGSYQENEKDDIICTKEGFVADKNNCKKFYRCVDDGRGSLIKHEFKCGEGTYWNQEILSCDHTTSDKHCGDKESTSTTQSLQHEDDEMNNTDTTTASSSPVVTDGSGEGVITEKPQSLEVCNSEGFYGDPKHCKKFYRCVDNGKGSYTKYDFACGDGTVWDQEIQACNHESGSECISSSTISTSQSSSTQTVTSGISTSTNTETQHSTEKIETSSLSTSSKCASEGFFAHAHDCKKFIRCVKNGKGGYTKHEFACGEGTVWVQDMLTCDHDNGNSNCRDSTQSTIEPLTTAGQQQTSEESKPSVTSTSKPQTTDKLEDEYNSGSSGKPSGNGTCTSEGYYGDASDCTRFYRCVDNGQGGYTKYDYSCGEGTAWDSEIQNCNHIDQVKSCHPTTQETGVTYPVLHEEGHSQTTDAISTSTSSATTTSSAFSQDTGSNDSCVEEGFFGNMKDCTKFYRCVDNGKGGYTKYDFTCGEGTIWDPDVTTCNHPQDVANPSCSNHNGSSTTTTTVSSSSPTSTGDSTTQSTSSSSSTTQSTSSSDSTTQSITETTTKGSPNCSQEESSKKPINEGVNCTKEGYFPNPNDCKKYYRCVDWNGDGSRFSVYHFECGEGTIWDPALETCNHEESVYPPRNCSGSQPQNVDQQTTTTEGTSTNKEESTSQISTTSQPTTSYETTQSSTSEQTTIMQSTTSEQTTTQQSVTSEQTTTPQSTYSEYTTIQQSTTPEQTTTQESTTSEHTTQISTTSEETTTLQSTALEQTTTQQSTTLEQTTTQQSTTSEQTTTPMSTSSEQTTTQQSTTQQSTSSQQTTQESSTSEQTTTLSSTTEETTTQASTISQPNQESTTSEHTTQESSTTEQTTQQPTTSQQTTAQQSTTESTTSESTTTEPTTSTTTEQSTTEQSTTEQQTTTEQTTQSSTSGGETTDGNSSEKECPDTDDDQHVFVCPTSFRRHPKYCNIFYQCTEDDSRDVQVATFTCPNNTIYDENQTKCVEESKANKKCQGEIAQSGSFKRLDVDYREPIVASKQSYACSNTGYFAFEKDSECSPAFYKCKIDNSKRLRGYVYQCPTGYFFWSISRRCEPINKIKDCKRSSNDWSRRWEIPVERRNVASS